MSGGRGHTDFSEALVLARPEQSLYADSRVTVTPTRAVINGATYPIANISSVRSERDLGILYSMTVLVTIALVTATLVAGFFGFENPRLGPHQWLYPVAAAMGIILAIFLFRRYKLTLTTTGRDVAVVRSPNEGTIIRIQAALEKAIDMHFGRADA